MSPKSVRRGSPEFLTLSNNIQSCCDPNGSYWDAGMNREDCERISGNRIVKRGSHSATRRNLRRFAR